MQSAQHDHQQRIPTLYRQWQQSRQAWLTTTEELNNSQQQLLLSLYVCTEQAMVDQTNMHPLIRYWQQLNATAPIELADLANEQQSILLDAISLSNRQITPKQITDLLIKKRYQAGLLKICQQQAIKLTREQLSLIHEDAHCQIALMDYLMMTNVAPVKQLWQRHYQPTLTHNAVLLAKALLCGLVHGESGIMNSLSTAITEQPSAALLEVAALSGDEQFIEMLIKFTEKNPSQGCRLLAIHGHAQTCSQLIIHLKNPAHHVVDAWQWLTGETLGLRPQLQLINSNTASTHTIADVTQALQWQTENQPLLTSNKRIINGQAFSRDVLLQLSKHWQGQAQQYLAILMRLAASELKHA